MTSDLGKLAGIPISVVMTDEPWDLEVDTLVISVGHSGLGRLGLVIGRKVPGDLWRNLDTTRVTPDTPTPVELPQHGAQKLRHLRRLVCATVRDPRTSTGGPAEGPASLDNVGIATKAALVCAGKNGARAIGLPLLGAGTIGLSSFDVAAVMMSALRAQLRETTDWERPAGIVFVCLNESSKAAIERAWDYQRILQSARQKALSDPAIESQLSGVDLDDGEIQRILDVDEGILWQPCLKELNLLRRLDQEAHGRQSESLFNEELQTHERWRELAQRRDAAARLLDAMVERSFLPRLRLEINKRQRDQLLLEDMEVRRRKFREPLTAVNARALRALPTGKPILPTAAQRELERLIDPERSPYASIGVAGPRGCGKSTLLGAVYRGWKDEHPRLSPTDGLGVRIEISAPASYVPREFLLHLYGLVCVRVLEFDPDARRDNGDSRRNAQLRPFRMLSLILVPAVMLAVGIAVLATGLRTGPDATVESLAALGGSIVVAALVPFVLLLLQRRAELRAEPNEFESHSESDGAEEPTPTLSPRGRLRRIPDRLGWRLPGPLRVLVVTVACGALIFLAAFGPLGRDRTTGLILVLAAIGTSVFRLPRRSRRGTPAAEAGDEADLLWRAGTRLSIVMAVAAAQLVSAIAGLTMITLDHTAVAVTGELIAGTALAGAGCIALITGVRWRAEIDAAASAGAAPIVNRASRRAARDLARIRYQTSVASGWTSAAKFNAGSWLPLGMEAGTSGSKTEAELPLGMPDIVDRIRSLLPARGPALVVIDELDKIESVEDARHFLNEIKGIFGAESTYFVISMSEDAIAKFERRGLPFRDVFDSAFHDIVRMPYLTSGQARDLLNERVTEVPEPFLGLAYCQSGGLPRDLLRAMDRMVTSAEDQAGGRPLPTLAAEVLHRDLVGKTAAVTAAIRLIVIEPVVSQVLRCLQNLDRCDPAGQRQGRCFMDPDWLSGIAALGPLIADDDRSDIDQRRELHRLTAELLGYFYYCRTLLEIFDVTSDPANDRLIKIVNDGDSRTLDDLARARQDFAVNPFVAWAELTDVREGCGLAPLAFPAPLVVGWNHVPEK